MSDPTPDLDRTNPKDRVGQSKIDLSLFPPAAHIHGAHAFMDGANKYGAYNWREKQVRARVYISAAQRHLADFLDGEDVAEDGGVHHLGHVIACCGIILDALETGNLIDDRPVTGAAASILARLNAAILARQDAGIPASRHEEPATIEFGPGYTPEMIERVERIVSDLASTPTITLAASDHIGKTEVVMARVRRALVDEVDPFPTGPVEPVALRPRDVAVTRDCLCPDGQVCPGVDAAHYCPRAGR